MKKRGKKQQLDPRVQLAIAIVAPLLVLALGWKLLVAPQKAKTADVTAQIAQVQQQVEQNQIASRQSGKPEVIRAADVFRLSTAMPDAVDMPGIILQLSQVAEESGIRFSSIAPEQQEVPGSGFTTMKIDLVFNGNFYGLSDFLYRLRNLVGVRGGDLTASGRLFAVEKLAFAEGGTGFPQITASLTLDTYVYGTIPTPGAAPVAPPAPTATDGSTTTTTGSTTTTESGATAAGTTGVTG